MSNQNIGAGNGKTFKVKKGAYLNNPFSILNKDGEIKQTVLKRFLILAELEKEKATLREWLLSFVQNGTNVEQGDLRLNVNAYERKVFDKATALNLLAELGVSESDLSTIITAYRVDIR